MRIVSKRETDGRVYNVPTTSEVAMLIPGDFTIDIPCRDIIVEEKSGKLQRISEILPCYLPLQYPLLFPYGEDGFRTGIEKHQTGAGKDKKNKFISIRQWFAFRIHERKHEKHILLRSKRLWQQFLVDSYIAIESNRLGYIKLNQSSLRADNYNSVQKASEEGKCDLKYQGLACYLPATFTGGPRYMRNMYLDAMAVCKHFGFPDYFITFTCNPKWPELIRFCGERNLRVDDRPEIICKIFKMKLDSLMLDLTKRNILGKTSTSMYTIEFQKRGLPHAHILIWLDSKCKLTRAEHIDKAISAEIPDKLKDPELFEVIKEMMVHGPCGVVNPKCPCMENGKCSKFYPKDHVPKTIIDKEGFPIYRRRRIDDFVQKKDFKCDNRYVIPYNRSLSLRYRAHINVEWCNQSGSVKYIFKYIHKGPDRVTVVVGSSLNSKNKEKGKQKVNADTDGSEPKKKNEVEDFFNCRYVSACEAAWRILKYPIHYRSTSVMKLSFHLPGEQYIYFKGDEEVETVLNKADLDGSIQIARKLTYPNIPTRFTYDPKEKKFNLRKKGFAIGRINYVPRDIEDGYYLRILLNVVPGPRSFEELKTVNGVLYKEWKDACEALGLLDNDQEYIDDLKRTSFWSSGWYLRQLFVIMLDALISPENVWAATWQHLSEDIQNEKKKYFNRPVTCLFTDLILSDEEKKVYALQEIDHILRRNGTSLTYYKTMPQVPRDPRFDTNVLILDEKGYDRESETKKHADSIKKLTLEQKSVYDNIIGAVNENVGGVFFVYGFGGTGKTFLWKTLSAALRSKGDIVLNVASSGIASLLLEGGRTAHSRSGIPLNPNEFTTCNMKAGSDRANLVKEASLIIWDEAPMMSRHCFESLDRSLSDICGNCDNKPFGGKVVVFGGDFRQVLPVIPGADTADIVMAALNSSYLWSHCKVLTLTKNMCLFSEEWILAVGDGRIGEPNDGEALIDIPSEFLITKAKDPIQAICTEIYGDITKIHEQKDPVFFQERAILCPTNEDVNQINETMLDNLQGEELTFLSSDSLDTADIGSRNNPVLTPEFLNNVKVLGLSNHKLRLKIGSPVMLLRNIDPIGGLMNGTRLQIMQMSPFILQAMILTGDRADTKLPFRMRRTQLPLAVCFAMTINKSQGQSLKRVGIFLPRPCFSHSQLYVAISRVTSKSGLKILIVNDEGKPQKQTKKFTKKFLRIFSFHLFFTSVGFLSCQFYIYNIR
uniref:ATP-dependent DNA helicase n=1 Tax=Arabidopsis thaliana TaxID=3702 RepID=Q9SI21_ARATH|nr:putative helicase [Arabidopsis thaliana]